jgi:hypothetical protein
MILPDGTVVTADGGVVIMSNEAATFVLVTLALICLAAALVLKVSIDLKLFI